MPRLSGCGSSRPPEASSAAPTGPRLPDTPGLDGPDAGDRVRSERGERFSRSVTTRVRRTAAGLLLVFTAVSMLPLAAQAQTTPGMPTNLGATTISETRITLSWTAPANTGGANTAITGYKIEYSAPDYLFPDHTNAWDVLDADTGTASTTYTHDHDLAPGVRLEYRVSAINEVGAGEPSTVANAITQAVSDTAGNGAPDPTGITVNGTRVVLTFDENLDANSTPSRIRFQVTINNGRAKQPRSMELTGATVVLTLAEGDAVDADDVVDVRYTRPHRVIGDAKVPTASALQDTDPG